MRLATLLTFALALPAAAQDLAVCRARDGRGQAVAALTKVAGDQVKSHVPAGTWLHPLEQQTVAGKDWFLVYPESQLPENHGWLRARDLTCDGRLSILYNPVTDASYQDPEPEFTCVWAAYPGKTTQVIAGFDFSQKASGRVKPKADALAIPAPDVALDLRVNAQVMYQGQRWVNATYLPEDNALGWMAAHDIGCNR